MTGDKELLRISIKLGEWEIRNQSADGAIGEILKDGSLRPKYLIPGKYFWGIARYMIKPANRNTSLLQKKGVNGSYKIRTQADHGKNFRIAGAVP